MYATRIPAFSKYKIDPDKLKQKSGGLRGIVPEEVNWPADNYNHLFEAPVLFYVVMVVLALVPGGGAHSTAAWLYVLLRIVHSLYQCLINGLKQRFFLFASSSFVLFWLTFQAARLVSYPRVYFTFWWQRMNVAPMELF